ncbi:MAG: bifunctional 2-polyprenyl-6-hydroxyphenol methylase/3-demethylubiquinol 3-O-methyltransferase UbiG, partial [Plesiomonas sp.]
RLVKPNGHVFFSTLNRNPKSFLFAIVGAEYLLRMVPKGTHNFKKFIRPSELLHWIDATPLREQDIMGITFNPLLNQFSLRKDIDVNYMIHTRCDDLA